MATAFVSGGSGYIGRIFVRALVDAGHRARVLTRSAKSAEKIRTLGAEPIEGDLLVPGSWQSAAREAEWVVHLAQPQTFGGRVTRARAETYREDRLRMDRNLLGPLDPGTTRRVVYVGGTSYYGNLGPGLRDETAMPVPRGWGPYIAPSIEALAADLDRGLPVVTAFPGYVYGDGSWFREYMYRPLRKGVRINAVGGRSRLGSPIHVRDCARALLFLCDHGEIGKRYFVVDDRPVAWSFFHEVTARSMGVPLRVRRVPPIVLRLLVGKLVTDSLLSDSVLSNARLKGLGFSFEFPTIETGIPDVVENARPLTR